MSSFFGQIRRKKSLEQYINELSQRLAIYQATQNRVEDEVYKSVQRLKTYKLILRETATAQLGKIVFPPDGGPPEVVVPGEPDGSKVTIMLNFDHGLEDASTFNNDAIAEYTNNQVLFTVGQNQTIGFALDFNPFRTLTPPPTPITTRMRYMGGPLLNRYSVGVVNIWWGSQWNSGTHQSWRNELQSDFVTICNSDHFAPFWQYGNSIGPTLKPHVQSNLVSTVSLPSATVIDFETLLDFIDDRMDAGQVPKPENFGDPAFGTFVDYQHIYFVVLPEGKQLPPGFGGVTSNRKRRGHNVWYLWCAMMSPYLDPRFPSFDEVQMEEQRWAHELVHQLENPHRGDCSPASQGLGGWLYIETSGECSSLQHASPGCGARLRELSGTNVVTESIWSDMDGKCVAAGSGDTWRQAPVIQPGPPTYDKVWVPFSQSTEMVYNRTSGFSVFVAMNVANLPPFPGAQKSCIWQKMDDLDNAAQARIGTDGIIHFIVRKAGVEYKVKSAVVPFGTWLNCWFVFNGTNTVTIYVNNTQYTTASTDVLAWNNTHSHFIIGNYNLGNTATLANASFRGKIDEIRLYRIPVLASDVESFNINGFTITDIGAITDKRQVFIVNRVLIDSREHTQETYVENDVVMDDVLTNEEEPGAGPKNVVKTMGLQSVTVAPGEATITTSKRSFTSTSFTSTSFTT